ncbi:hypothetical protein Tco_1438527 [Tanacetum coccineum]
MLYPTKEIQRISTKTSQESAFGQFPIRRIRLLPYVVSMKITIRRYNNKNLFTYDIQNIKTNDEYERELNNDIARGAEEPWWYDELADGKLKDETLALKAKVKGSWGDATPEVMKFYAWLKNNFENFHELDYDVLVKLQECWWKTSDPYLDVNRIFGKNYEASNVDDTQENQGHEEHTNNPTPEPSNCKIRRFEMIKYTFNDDEEYIIIKESEYLNHSKDSLDAYRELLRLINEGWAVTTPKEE